jgi:hypothetical protein
MGNRGLRTQQDDLATPDELIARQYADRPHLRAVYDAIINAAMECGEIMCRWLRHGEHLLGSSRCEIKSTSDYGSKNVNQSDELSPLEFITR